MKKLISICLMLMLAGGLILAENSRAEAIDPASAALIAASFMFLPIIAAVSHDHHDHDRSVAIYDDVNYDDPRPERSRVYYNASHHERYYGRNWDRGNGFETEHHRHRRNYEDRRSRGYDRYRYAGRHYSGND